MYRIRLLTFFVLFLMVSFAKAQVQDQGWVQFSGIVLSSDSLKPVSYTTIMVRGTNRGTIADRFGFFSLVVHKKEILEFTSIGFKKASFKVPDTITDAKYSLVQLLTADTICLAPTIIFPWPTFPQFKQAFVTVDVPNDMQETAEKNIELAKIKDLILPAANDGSMNFRQQIYNQASKNYYAGQIPPNNFLNPLAWKKFIEAWQRGDFKQKKY